MIKIDKLSDRCSRILLDAMTFATLMLTEAALKMADHVYGPPSAWRHRVDFNARRIADARATLLATRADLRSQLGLI
jgi:hypothetical protein